MKVTVENVGKNVVKLDVEVDAEKGRKSYEVACRRLSQRVKIPGFRPGKVPRNMIESAFGVESIKREALEHLVPEVIGKVIFEQKLDLITEPKLDGWTFELGEPVKLAASFEVRPVVTLGEYRGHTFEVSEAKLPEDAIDRALASIAESRATVSPAGDRPLALGDTALIDFECLVDDQPVPGGKAQGLLLEIREGNFLEGFCEQLVSKRAGEECQVRATFPENYRNTELAGKEATFKVDLKEVRERVLPAIDDELAKALGQDSLKDLFEVVGRRLQDEITEENQSRAQKAVVDKVVALAQVDIPDTMIERERDLLVGQVRRQFESNGHDWEAFAADAKYQEFEQEKSQEASQRVLTSLVLGAVVRQENLTVSDNEVAPYLAELVSRYNVPVDQLGSNEDVRRALQELRRQAVEECLTRKVVEFLVAQSEVRFVQQDAPAREAQPAGEVQ
jgi:trigger factor